MDQRVIRAMELLKEAGCLDLIAAPAAPRDRPVRRAASGVAAAVAACSPLQDRKQVSGAGRGRSGRLALTHKGRVAVGSRSQLRPLGARRPRGARNGGAGGGAGNPSVLRPRQLQVRPMVMSGARTGGGHGEAQIGGARGAGRQVSRKVVKAKGHASLPVAGVTDVERHGVSKGGMRSGGGEQETWGQGQSPSSGEEGLPGHFEGLGGGELEPVKELSHILEWSDESDQGGGEVRDQEVEEDGLAFRERGWGPRRAFGGLGTLGGGRSDGRLSTASWTGYRRGGKAVRAKEVVTQSTTGPGFAPPSGRVSKGRRPGYASQREGHQTALRRPRIPAAQLEEFIKKARFGSKSWDMDTDEMESGDSLDFDEDSVEEGEIRDEEVWWALGGGS
ncbi:hypothetical protein NDU88_004138 [Pleurodeles waltl]|uniref:Uncharacterized protein n=1 Tax=Pleurodeles waltl TaxID=8319 RepID=A0AAV7N0M7_PLEWA|nr:hypothetical protein NDU88_004138 [Pleurodeles waltl]